MTRDDQIRKMREDGMDGAAIAEALGISRSTVQRSFRTQNIAADRSKQNITPDDVKTLYQDGMTIEKIAAHFGCSPSMVCSRLDAAGVVRRKNADPDKAWNQVTQGDFIRRAKEAHGNKYDYSNAVFTGTKAKVEIICPDHGSFIQEAGRHMSGAGCRKCASKARQATMIKKYGVAHALQSDVMKEKSRNTCLERYGVDNAMRSDLLKEKHEVTCMERYGASSSLGSSIIREKVELTMREKHGGNGAMCDPAVREKAKQTNLNRYGSENVMGNEGVKGRLKFTMEDRYGAPNAMMVKEFQEKQREAQIETLMERYGTDSPLDIPGNREKAAATMQERYGVGNAMHSQDLIEKMTVTKVVNGTTSTSEPEETMHAMLCNTFGADDVVRQHVADPYPWACDFYIKSRDMRIELNASPFHHTHWFDVDCEADVDACETMRLKGTKYYAKIIETWTERDVEKRKAAADNGLNYVVFWDSKLRDFELWLAMGMPDGKDWDCMYSWLPGREIKGPESVSARIGNKPQDFTRIVKAMQFHVFYAREEALWDVNPRFRETTLQVFLYHNRMKYLDSHKLPHQLTDLEIMRGFTISGILKGYTAFDASMMLEVLGKYGIRSVYDPCSGWGERALCCKANGVSYYGVDINEALFPGYEWMRMAYGMENQRFLHGDSAFVKLDGKCDAVITCPPYGDTEVYSKDGAENLPEQEFLDWWGMVAANSKNLDPSYFCFQVNRKWRDRMLERVEVNGFVLIEEIFPKKVFSSHFTRQKGGVSNKKEFETMLICKRNP